MKRNALFFLILLFALSGFSLEENPIEKPFPLPGPHPIHSLRPVLTTAAIIEIYNKDNVFEGIVLIHRGKAPFGPALPGGKVEWGETVEQAVRREMMEEVSLELKDLKQFHVYSDPMRDKRHHSIEVTFLAKASSMPHAGDDAKDAFIVNLNEIPWDDLAFDHSRILKDYIAYKNGNLSLALLVP